MARHIMRNTVDSLEVLRMEVKPAWLDYNQHMNAGCYAVAFDLALDCFTPRLGMGEAYSKSGVGTTFTLESHITYLRELRKGDWIRITLQLLDYDQKRIHHFLSMYHAERGFLAATSEQLSTHIDLSTRRAAPMPDKAQVELEAIWQEHRHLPKPEQVGKNIGIRRKAVENPVDR